MSYISNDDQPQLENKGISQKKVLAQLETFKEGIPFVRLEKAAVVGDGILRFSDTEQQELIKIFDNDREGKVLLKFVPASGAASRMFKALFYYLELYDSVNKTFLDYIKSTNDTYMQVFSDHLADFPFYGIVAARIKGKSTTKEEEIYQFVKELLSESGLNYGFYPKGLLPFHNYGDYAATPFEEHLREAALYSSSENTAQLHFTISEQHGAMFNEEFAAIKERISSEMGASYEVSYSYQKAATDTLAVDMENRPFRNHDGSLLFRPGGHGALIENLNEQDADIIFIKNIDNVVVAKEVHKVADSKKVLAGLLLRVQRKAFEFARVLEEDGISDDVLNTIKDFLETEMNSRFLDSYLNYNRKEQIAVLKDKIHRPIRICGMVKNEGEPGGGPFWIRDAHHHISLQIIESAQIDALVENQVHLLQNATHFNPVDLVCAIKDYKGIKYDLLNFVDHKQGFITKKTKDGKELKSLELPGLWNGAMAFWNTIFVEMPLATFNPVKTVNDLLKPSHQVN